MRTLYENGVRATPCAPFARACPPREGDSFTLPLLRGRAAEGGRGSLTHPLCILLLLLLLFAPSSFAQNQTPLQPESLVDQWFIRLNALDDWYISYTGKEETDAVVDKFVDLYTKDAFHEVQPNENQLGHVVFHGHDGIRKWAADFAKKYVQLAYRIDYITRNEKSAQLTYAVKPAWGGVAAAVEFSAVYTNREDRKRFLIPGSAFFLFDDTGKIQRVRIYMLKDEAEEIEP